ncbi:MAG TPA: PAS domain-containing protein [Candidatus Acidoferrum sp.]
MKNLSDNWEELRLKVLGLGDSSVRKTHYPCLRKRLAELEQIRSKLQQSEAYLVEAQRLSHTGSWAWNVRTGALFWSQEIFRIYGYNPEETGPTWEQFLERVHPEDRAQIEQRAKLETTRKEWVDSHGDFRIVLPDGTIKYLHSVAHPATDASGEIAKIIGTVVDITEHTHLTHELQRREAYLAEAQRLSHTGSFGWRPDTGQIVWSDETYRIFEYDGSVKPTIDSLVQRVHPEDRANFKEVINRAFAGAPDFEHAYRLLLPDGRLKHVHAIAHVLQDTSGNREFVGAVTDITERKAAEEALRSSEAYLAEAQRLSQTGSWAWNAATGEPSYWSEECYRVLGYDPGEPLPLLQTFFQRILPEERAAIREQFDRAIRDKADFELELRFLHPITGIKNIRSTAHAVLDRRGDLREIVGTVIDITDRKRAEDEQRRAEAMIREQEAELRQVVDTMPAIVWVALPDGSNSYVSNRLVEYFGMPPEQLAGLGWQAATHPDDLERHNAKWLACVGSGKPFEDEVRFRRADGQYRWHLERGVPLRDEAGNIVKWYGVLTDIEDRKRAEDKIREQETELREILDLAPQLVSVFGPDRERLYANRNVLDYLGIGLDEWREKSLGTHIHPDDLERVEASWDRALESGSGYDVELRLRKHDGSYRWFLGRYNPVRDDKGQIMRWYVAGTDIEDRKRAEDRLQHENVALREELDKTSMFEEIVGSSNALQTVLSRLSKVAPTDSSVLITGETGTGKELVARAIHRRSKRSARVFVSVNCAAIPRELIASELFGHEKGAFTGATQRRLGRFELAGGGTIFLDEVGELPAETQIALLRVLQEHEFERVGANQPIRADVRVIAATNRDLEAAITAGSFRRDLFYRLNVFPIEIPPLRERKQDIPMLVEYFIDRFARNAGKQIRQVNKKTLDLLQSYPWPGNIRELQNVIERSVIVCESENFSVDESWLSPQPLATEPKRQPELPRKLAAQEKEMIEAALRESGGQVSGPAGAAAKLGLPGSTLESKIRSFKIDKKRFKTTNPSADRI